MANEDAAQGIDELLEDIPEGNEQTETQTPDDTPADDTAAEPQTETQVQPKDTEAESEPEESLEESESQVAKLFPTTANIDHSGKTVPLDKHTKLRERAQNAEAERDALKAQQAEVDTTALQELVDLADSGDDEYVDKDKLKQVVEKLPQAINSIAQANINKVVQTASLQNLQTKAVNDEKAFRKDHDDYDAVTDFAKSRGLVSDAELKEVFASSNIAEAYYNLASKKIDQERQVLGVAKPSDAQPTNDNPPAGQTAAPDATGDDVPLDDDSGFDAFLGGGIGS